MKPVPRVLCLLMLLLLLLPASALARPYSNELVPSYSLLTPSQQLLVARLYAAAEAHEETVTLPDNTSYEDADRMMHFLLLEYPELRALDNAWTIGYYRDSPDIARSVTLQYTMSAQDEALTVTLMLNAAEKLADAVSGTDWDRALALHDALLAMTDYDDTGTAPYQADGPLLEGRAVCEGYAKAYALLCRLSGIPCDILSGTADGDPHSWCMTVLDGTPVLTDPTWDDQRWGTVHWYFALDDAAMSLTHTADDFPATPACTDASLTWAQRTGNLVDSEQALLALLKARMGTLSPASPLELTFADAALYESFTADMNGWISRSGSGFHGSYRFAVCDERLSVYLFLHE